MINMKKMFFTLVMAGFGFIVNTQPPAGDAKPREWYGEKISTEGALNINDVVAKLNGGSEFPEVKIKAKITEVCPKKGCWLKLELENQKRLAVVKIQSAYRGHVAHLALKKLQFEKLEAEKSKAAIKIQNSSEIFCSNIHFHQLNNSQSKPLILNNGTLTMTDCKLSGNPDSVIKHAEGAIFHVNGLVEMD